MELDYHCIESLILGAGIKKLKSSLVNKLNYRSIKCAYIKKLQKIQQD